MKVFRINDIILFYCYLCKTRNGFLVRSIIFQSFEQGSEWLVSQPHAAAVLLTEGLKSQPSQRLIADGSMWKSAYIFSFVTVLLCCSFPHRLFSRLNFIDFGGQHRSLFAFKFLGWLLLHFKLQIVISSINIIFTSFSSALCTHTKNSSFI